MEYNKIIFLCNGNTCRSPMAETIYRSMDTSSEMNAASRGLIVLFPEPPNPKAVLVLSNHNLSLENHTSAALQKEELDDHTLVLAMAEKHKEKLKADYQWTENVFTIKEFVGETGDVLDPYGGTLMDYEDCYVELARLVKKTVYRLYNEEEQRI